MGLALVHFQKYWLLRKNILKDIKKIEPVYFWSKICLIFVSPSLKFHKPYQNYNTNRKNTEKAENFGDSSKEHSLEIT